MTENLRNDPEHSLLTAALEYADRGWAVHALHTVVDGLYSCEAPVQRPIPPTP